MSNESEQCDPEVIGALRSMARQSDPPSAMMQELRRRLGSEMHVLALLRYFRHAFCLTLAEAKPIAALTRNAQRETEDATMLDELLLPAILHHRADWEGRK